MTATLGNKQQPKRKEKQSDKKTFTSQDYLNSNS